MATPVKESLAWRELLRHQAELRSQPLRRMVLQDAKRLQNFERQVSGLRLNYSLQHVTPETLKLLFALARQQNLEDWRARMLAGVAINGTEQRAVLHTALRRRTNTPCLVDGKDVMPQILDVRRRMTKLVEDIREGRWLGATGKPIRHVVNIGIGGSDLGPRLAARALEGFATGPRVHFVANVDAFDLLVTLRNLAPEETLFVVVSKTFTTQETILNASTAREWLISSLGNKSVARHFLAVSTNQAEVGKFGIDVSNMLPMWDWVGGRFSLWSAVGLSVALAIGNENFAKLLDGAAAMDAHFQDAPLEENLPVLLALLGVWQRNFQDARSLAILPYAERLRDLPRYLQQLDMESNGKAVTRDGDSVTTGTAPVIFGDCGTVGQHSFHQWLHQGTDPVTADFIGVVADDLAKPAHQRALLANMAAQASALAFGQTEAATPEEIYPGGRSSNLILLDRLEPYSLGLLLALYEHKIFTQGIIWNINSFDQPGVELGKRMARGLETGTARAGTAEGYLAGLFDRITRPG